MADETTILEGAVKFRDGKKWKPRWAVLRRLSPVADAVELSLWSERPVAGNSARLKAALGLSRWLGQSQGFTLDRHSHTLALLCEDCEPVLAFDSRERLVQWAARLDTLLGGSRRHEVVTNGERGELLVTGRRLALVQGLPPSVRGSWEIQHLRRFGVVDGRFVWEGGLLSGAGAGLHSVAAADCARIARDVELTAHGLLATTRRRPRTNTEDGCSSPVSSRGTSEAGTLRRMPRCASCSNALGSGGTGSSLFTPAWSMPPTARQPRPHNLPLPPTRPPKAGELYSAPVGPYDNYDVPKVPSVEEGEYYDTPRRLRSALGEGIMVRSLTCGESMAKEGGVLCGQTRRWAPCLPVWLLGSCRRVPPAPARTEPHPTSCPLYATVDVARKARRRAAARLEHYENALFVHSLQLYENARSLAPGSGRLGRAVSAEYLSMASLRPARAIQVPPGYARMEPAGRHARAHSDPSLLAEEPPRRAEELEPWARGGAGNRDSSSSGDSGLGLEPARRCRSAELLRCGPHPDPHAGATLQPRARSRAGDTSTSSGTSDLSDYMETLSLSSHSSADAYARWSYRLQPVASLRPRSGREYARPPLPPHPPGKPPHLLTGHRL